jgi:hypothetical protein
VRAVASQKSRGVTAAHSKESLEITPESGKPPIPEPEGEVSRALTPEKIKIQLQGNQPPVREKEENDNETGAGHTLKNKNYRKNAKKEDMENSDSRSGVMLDKLLTMGREAHQILDMM